MADYPPTSRTPVPLYGPNMDIIPPPRGGPVGFPNRSVSFPARPPIIDGEWSEVPRAISAGGRAVANYGGRGVASIGQRLLSLLGGNALVGTMAAPAEAALGPIGAVIAAGDGRGTNSPSDLQGLTQAYAEARAERQARSAPAGRVEVSPLNPVQMPPSANQYVAQNFPQGMDPAAPAKGDMQQMSPNQYVAQNFPPTMAQGGGGGVPMPQPRPGGAIAQAQMGLAPYDPNGSLSNKDANSIYDSFSASKAGQQMGMPQQAPGMNPNGSITGAMGPTSVNGAPLVAQAQPQSAWDHYVQTGTGILPRTINLLSSFNSKS